MKFRKPSPAMAVSVAALVMASTGSAVAAVSFATNAGAVDHKSAGSATGTNDSVAGSSWPPARAATTRARSRTSSWDKCRSPHVRPRAQVVDNARRGHRC